MLALLFIAADTMLMLDSRANPEAPLDAVRLAEDRPPESATRLADARKGCKRGSDLALALSTAAPAAYEEGVESYRRAIAAFDKYDEAATCLFELGAAWVDADKPDKAHDAFTRALILQPKYAPDTHHYAPNVVKAFNKAREGLNHAPQGTLVLVGDPEGALVTIDAIPVGALPLSLDGLAAGEHWLSVHAPGRRTFATAITIKPREVTRIEAFLRETPGAAIEARLAHAILKEPGSPLFDAYRGVAFIRFNGQWEALVKRRGAPVVKLTAKTAAQVAQLARAAFNEAPRVSASAPVQISAPPTQPAKRYSMATAWLPFGIAQYTQRRPLAGSLFLGSQALLLAANLSAYYVARGYRQDNGEYKSAGTVEVLKWVTNIAVGLLIADVIAGSIEGVVYAARQNP